MLGRDGFGHPRRLRDALDDPPPDEGTGADIDPLWNAVIEASVALTATPIAFGPEHVRKLRDVGLDDLAISDLIHSAAFFNWANRLMLSLGEPEIG